MGKLHLFGKAKRGAKKFSGLFTKKKNRTTRLPHSKRASKNKYPIIRKLKLSDCVPSTALGRLEHYAKDTKHNGAIQTIHLPNSSTLAYPVVVMNEDDMKAAGMTPKNGDLGYLSSSLSKDYIQPATLHADIQRGCLAIIPSDKSLENMESFDSLNKVKFHWALFLNTFKDGSDSNQVIILDNGVNLAQLINYNKSQPSMKLSGRKLIVSDNDSTGGADEPLQTNYTPGANSTSDQDASRYNSSNQVNPDNSINPNQQNDAQQEPNNSGLNQSIPQGPTPNNPRAMNQDTQDSQSSQPQRPAVNNPIVNGMSNPSQSSTAPSSSNNDATNPDDEANASFDDSSEYNTEPANDTQNDASDPELEKYEQPSDDDSDDIGSRTEMRNDPTEPKQSPKQYTKDIKKLSRAFYDNDLHIKIDLSDIQQVLAGREAPQLELLTIKPGDKLGHLKHLINIKILSRNKQLRQLHKTHNSQIMESARRLLSNTSSQISNILSPNNKASRVHQRYLRLKRKFKKAKKAQSATASQVTSTADKSYQSLKSQYTDAKASNAAVEFDQMHRRAHDAENNRTTDRIKEISQKDHISKVDALNKWRRKLAKEFLDETLNRIKSSAANKRDSAYHDEKSLCDLSNGKVNKELRRYYRDELRRVNRINYNNKHDHKIKRLKRSNKRLAKHYRQRMSTLKNDAHQDKLNSIKDQRDRMKAIIKNNQLLQTQLKKSMTYARKAGNTLPPKYERELKLENARVREIQKRNISDRKRYNQDLNDMSSAFRRKTDSIDQWKSRFIWYGTGGGVLLAIIVLIGGVSIGHLTSSPQTHYVREEVPSKGRGGNTTINNGNNQSPSSSKSSAYVNKHGDKSKAISAPGVVNRSLMTKRPPARKGLYIGTSTGHNPTSYMYVKHYHMYNKGDTVIGFKNNSKMHLKVTRVYKNMIFVADPSNNVHYEFNVY